MKNMQIKSSYNENYKEKIYNVTKFRLISFEIYKFFLFYLFMSIISSLSNHFPFSIFYELNCNFFRLIKMFIYSLILDMIYYFLFKSNSGQFSLMEIIINSFFKPNLVKSLCISISYALIYLTSLELKSLMPRLGSAYIKERYNIEPVYNDEDEENYYARKGLSKSTIYDISDKIFMISISFILLNHFIIIKQNFNLWPILDLARIINLKKNLWASLKNIATVGIPLFFIIYLILIFFYHSIFIFDICFNYTSLFVIEYNIFFISKECLINFICAKISYLTYEINNKEQLIKKEIDFKNEENFYIIHYLKVLDDIYKFPKDIKSNEQLLKFDNLNHVKTKIDFFMESINRKYSYFLGKKKYFNIGNNMNATDKLKIMIENIFEYIDYSGNQVLEYETCVQIIKYIIEIIGNIIIFIADAKIKKSNEEKYMDYSDYIYFFIERLFEIDNILLNLIQNKKISYSLRKDIYKLRIYIINYFDLVRNRQNRFHFIKLETQKIQNLLYENY